MDTKRPVRREHGIRKILTLRGSYAALLGMKLALSGIQ
jgi:hypothetical protein